MTVLVSEGDYLIADIRQRARGVWLAFLTYREDGVEEQAVDAFPTADAAKKWATSFTDRTKLRWTESEDPPGWTWLHAELGDIGS